MTRVDNAAFASNATDPVKASRREIFELFPGFLGFFIGSFRPPVPGRLVHRLSCFIPAAKPKFKLKFKLKSKPIADSPLSPIVYYRNR
jgi:hypothetical protein